MESSLKYYSRMCADLCRKISAHPGAILSPSDIYFFTDRTGHSGRWLSEMRWRFTVMPYKCPCKTGEFGIAHFSPNAVYGQIGVQ